MSELNKNNNNGLSIPEAREAAEISERAFREALSDRIEKAIKNGASLLNFEVTAVNDYILGRVRRDLLDLGYSVDVTRKAMANQGYTARFLTISIE